MKAQTLGALHCTCGQSATHTLIANGIKGYPYRKGEAIVVCDSCLSVAMEGPIYLYTVKAYLGMYGAIVGKHYGAH